MSANKGTNKEPKGYSIRILLTNSRIVHKRKAVIEDIPYKVYGGRTELVKRLLAEKCELCGSTENIEVHHIRKLADLKKKGQAEVPKWVQIMSARKRKTLVVCRECHVAIHNGNITKSS